MRFEKEADWEVAGLGEIRKVSGAGDAGERAMMSEEKSGFWWESARPHGVCSVTLLLACPQNIQ